MMIGGGGRVCVRRDRHDCAEEAAKEMNKVRITVDRVSEKTGYMI